MEHEVKLDGNEMNMIRQSVVWIYTERKKNTVLTELLEMESVTLVIKVVD